MGVRKTIYLPEGAWEDLLGLAEAEGRSISRYLVWHLGLCKERLPVSGVLPEFTPTGEKQLDRIEKKLDSLEGKLDREMKQAGKIPKVKKKTIPTTANDAFTRVPTDRVSGLKSALYNPVEP